MKELKEGALVPTKITEWYNKDRAHSAKWRREAKEEFDFGVGRQWNPEDKQLLQEQLRPVITFNYTGAYLDAIHGLEIGNRQQIRYLPREMGDVKANELLTGAGDWYRDQSSAEEEESEAFLDTAICGMGWTEDRIDYEDSPEGTPFCQRLDPLEMLWDCQARKKNISDSTRRWRVREVPLEEAREMFPDRSASDLDASWATVGPVTQPHENDGLNHLGAGQEESEKDTVTIVQCQYKVKEAFYKVINPFTNEEDEWTEAQWKLAQKAGVEPYGNKFTRKVVKQAFLGGVVLKVGDAPSKKGFSFNCITGKRDNTEGTWFGLVRAMKDPQKWSNKWRSQLLHIINSNAKGGIIAEEGAFSDQREAEETWAQPDAITWVNPGGIEKIQPKPQAAFPAGHQYLTESAEDALRKVSNISLELLGMAEMNQPGVLEHQRKQSGMTALQPLLDSLRAYRKIKGVLILDYIQNYFSDNRLIRISGENGEQYVPLVRQASAEYDIIVDEAPTSPNQKERVWGLLQTLLPTVREMVTPEVLLELLQYSPLPSTVIEKLRQMQKQAQEQGAPEAQAMRELQKRGLEADISKTESEAVENIAEAQWDLARAKKDGVESAVTEAQLAMPLEIPAFAG